MTANPFAQPSPSVAADPSGNAPAATPANDIDFSVDVPTLQLGLFRAHVSDVKKGSGSHSDKLLIEFKLDEGPVGNKVTFWGDPKDRESMLKLGQLVNALGVEIVTRNGSNVPTCGWLGLKDRTAKVAVDAYNGRLQIPRFGRIRHDDCPREYKDRDFGCGVLPIDAS